jgi:4-amino-4-deoxy-L-arabinose transferase-like glycosyltransferase
MCKPAKPSKLNYEDRKSSVMTKRVLWPIRGMITASKVHVLLILGTSFTLRLLLATSPFLDIDESGAYAPTAFWYLNGNYSVNIEHPMFVKELFAGSVALFGANGKVLSIFPWLPSSIGALRLVSVVLGSGTCLVAYLLVREITGNHTAALISGILLAFDPISICNSSYGILDPPMTFFYMASILFFYRYLKIERSRDFYASAILFGVSVASKYYAFIAIFTFLGVLLWKRKLTTEWKSMSVFLGVAIITFFAVQPYLWWTGIDGLLNTLSRSWVINRIHLMGGHLVKQPGNPFLIPQGHNLAPKPEFYSTLSEATYSPWWYIAYIQAMYATPFQLLAYPYAVYKIAVSIIRRKSGDAIIWGILLPLIPTIYFAIQPVRLTQYATLNSASYAILSSIAFLHFPPKHNRTFLASFMLLHVGWVLLFFSTSSARFTGWGFYSTPITPIMGYLFQMLFQYWRGWCPLNIPIICKWLGTYPLSYLARIL